MSPRNAYRLLSAGFQISRSGAFGFVDVGELPARAALAVKFARWFEPRGLSDTDRGRRLAACLHRLGPSYVKLGQFLATRPDIVGTDMANALGELKDKMPPFPVTEAKARIESSLGQPADVLFDELGEPVAAASIAQVFRTRAKAIELDEMDVVAAEIVEEDILVEAEPDAAPDDECSQNGEFSAHSDSQTSDQGAGSTVSGGASDGIAVDGNSEDGNSEDGDQIVIDQVETDVEVEDEEPATVALKVLRPGVRARFRKDLDTFYAAARFIEKAAPDLQRLKPVIVVETLERTVVLEMDLRLEAAALGEMAEFVKDDRDFRVPAVHWDYTGRDVLTTEWVDGISLVDLKAIDEAHIDRKALAATVVQSFLRHALQYGFFHADMHEGNLFVDSHNRLIAVDLGIMGRIGFKEQRFLAEILYGFICRDYRRIAEVHFEAGYVPANHDVADFAQALRAIGEPIHGQSANDISMAKLLGLLFEITDIFDMQTRPELILLQKTMVVVEGVARRLDPDFDMWSSSEPVVRQWIERHLGPAGQISHAAGNLAALGRLVGQVPELAAKAERLGDELDAMGRDGLRLDEATVQAIGKSEARHTRSGRIALWVIAAAIVVLVFAVV